MHCIDVRKQGLRSARQHPSESFLDYVRIGFSIFKKCNYAEYANCFIQPSVFRIPCSQSDFSQVFKIETVAIKNFSNENIYDQFPLNFQSVVTLRQILKFLVFPMLMNISLIDERNFENGTNCMKEKNHKKIIVIPLL